MPCACCETGRCCDGATCTAGETHSKCAYDEGTFTTGGTCSPQSCYTIYGNNDCYQTNACACLATDGGRTLDGVTTCDCNVLTAAGAPFGGCRWRMCEQCNTGTGACVSVCASPRECCAGTCCAETEYCSGSFCQPKCTGSNTYCNTSNDFFYVYECCTPSQKCCGSSGCQAKSTTNFTVDVTQDVWVDTGVTIATGEGVTITASGTVQWSGAGSTATPNGVAAGVCYNFTSCSPAAALCHMALIGRIGAGGTPFRVGSSYAGSPGAGRLYLRQNDSCISDNSGNFTGTIVTDPCPGYTPAAIGEPIVYAPGEDPPAPHPGAGTELKRLLSLGGIVASPTCSCNARAAQMDTWGEWECLKRLPEICGWLKEEANKRDLWFFPPAGAVLILAAISLAALKRPFRGNNR